MSDDLRETIRESIAEVSANAQAPTETAAPAETADTSAADVIGTSGADEAVPPVAGSKARDASGKFVKADSDKTVAPKAAKPVVTHKPTLAPATTTATAEPVTPSAPSATKLRAPPQSWGAVAREHWGSLPEAVQEHWLKREGEMARRLQEADKHQKFQQSFQEAVTPYSSLIQAGGGDPVRYVSGLLQEANSLFNGPMQTRASALARIAKSTGVPVEMLAAAYDGTPMPQGQGAQPSIDPQTIVQQAKAELWKDIQAQQQEAANRRAMEETAKFAEGREFFEDLREDMAELIDLAARRGRAMSMEEAYNKAAQLHPEVSKVISQRAAVKQVETVQAATQRAKAAASSPKSEPTGAVAPKGGKTTVRDSIRETLSELGRSR